MTRTDPLRNMRFLLEVNNVTQAGFSEVAIAESTTEAIEYRNGNEPTYVRKLSGLTKYGNVTLKRGVTASTELYDWFNKIATGQLQDNRRTVAVVVQDEKGDARARIVLYDAWPTKLDFSDLNGKGNETFIESLEIVVERMEHQKVGA